MKVTNKASKYYGEVGVIETTHEFPTDDYYRTVTLIIKGEHV